MRVIVTEYPKSGGTWFTSLLGDILGIPKRDIYVNDQFTVFDVRKHPWYIGSNSLNLPPDCVIKSHELPGSVLTNFPAQIIHLVRDGRDVIVSKFFFEKDFYVKNNISAEFNDSFDSYVPRIAREWQNYVTIWLSADVPICRYEDLLTEPYTVLAGICHQIGVQTSASKIWQAIENNSVEKTRRALDQTFRSNTFVRRATSGDWKDHFNQDHSRIFAEIAGDLLLRLGYKP